MYMIKRYTGLSTVIKTDLQVCNTKEVKYEPILETLDVMVCIVYDEYHVVLYTALTNRANVNYQLTLKVFACDIAIYGTNENITIRNGL